MPLTRHLYELDEVISALQISLRRRWPGAYFWTWELVQSSEEKIALSTIQQTWLEYGNGNDPEILTIEPKSPADWCSLVQRVSYTTSTRFHVITLLNAAAHEPPPQIDQSPSPPTPKPFLTAAAAERIDLKMITRIWKMFYNATAKKEWPALMWILQALQPILSADTIWILINAIQSSSILQKHATPHPESQLLHQANAILSGPMSIPEDAAPISAYVDLWNKWSTQVGRRSARIREIPAEALHRETTRGRIPSRYTNIEDVRDPVAELPRGCKWWRSQTAAMGIHIDDEGALVFPSDDILEAFYERYFPDDIPDEWSARDQQMSHGRGCAETASDPPPLLTIREEPIDEDFWNPLGLESKMATLAIV